MGDKWNSKWRPPPSWIYYFCRFWSNGIFPVAAVYMYCKFSFIYVNWRLSYCSVQNSKTAAAAILNFDFVMLDQPRSPFVHRTFFSKFCVDWVRIFQDIAIQKFSKFGLKCLLKLPKIMFWGVLTPKHYFLSSWPPKGTTLRGNTRFEP